MSFKPNMQILPAQQQEIWPHLKQAPQLGFVLYGGTAIALRLGHRISIDFDFFSQHPLDRVALQTAFPFISDSTILQDERNTLCLLTPSPSVPSETVKLSFFGAIGFGRIGQPEWTEDGILQVASLDDLMATKLKVILQRAEAKDYRDIAVMINAGRRLDHALGCARALFGSQFQPSESLKALTYFHDGDLHTLTEAEKHTLTRAVHDVNDILTVPIISRSLMI